MTTLTETLDGHVLPAVPVTTLRDVELRHLAALRAVAEEHSFGRAAQRLGFTQSAISQQIGALERIVGEPLFERPGGPRPVRLTPAGRVLLPHAVAMLDRVKTAEADLAGHRSGETGTVRVGTFQSTSVRILPELLTELAHQRPHLSVRLFESDDQDELLARLRAGELDVTFVVEPVVGDDLEVFRLCTDPFVVLCPPGSSILPAEGPVPAERLLDVELVGQHPSACQLLIEDGLARRGLQPTIAFRTGDNAAVQAMVRAGFGHAVMPRLAIDADDPGVVVRDLDPPIPPRAIALAMVSGRRRAPSVEVFHDLALEWRPGRDLA